MAKKKKHSRKSEQKIEPGTAKESFSCKAVKIWGKYHDLLSILMLAVLLLIFYAPVMFSNKTLLPPDTVASKSFQPFVKEALHQGVYPLWNPYIFSGMPSFASLSRAPYMDVTGDVINGIIWLCKLVLPLTDFTRLFLNYLLFGGLLYFLLRKKGLDPVPALFSSAALVFMPQIVAYAAFGHTTKLATAALIPLVFLLVDQLLKKQNILYFSLTSLAVGLQLLRFHVQINFYSALLAGAYFIFWAIISIKDKEKAGRILKGALLLGAAFFMGFVVSSVVNLSVWEYSHYSIRGGAGGLSYGYATNWSFPPSEIITFFNPSFMGFGGRETYWGAMPFTDFPMYFGSVILLLAGLAYLIKKERITLFFMIVAVIALFISFGKHFPVLYGPMFKIFPFFNKFRAPKMIHILIQISMAVLAGFGLQAVLNFDEDEKSRRFILVKRYLLIFTGITAAIFLFLLVGKGTYMHWAVKARAGADQAFHLALTDGFKELVYVLLAALFIFQTIRKKMNKNILPLLLIAIIIVDFWMIDRRFVEHRPAASVKSYFEDTGEVAFLKKQTGFFRILPVADRRTPNWYMYHSIESAYGYQGAKVKIYQKLMDNFKMPDQFLIKYLKQEGGRYVWRKEAEISSQALHAHRTFLQLTNTKYIVTPYGIAPYNIPDSTLRVVYRPKHQGMDAVLEFTRALPRVYFPKKIIPVTGDKTMLQYIASSGFNAEKMAVIDGKPEMQIEPSDSNYAEITEKGIQNIKIDARAATPCLMVLSEVYYPAGWKAYVDGDQVKIERVNYAFRGVYLKPGRHHVEFIFKPESFTRGLWASIVSFGLLIAGAVFGFIKEKKRKRA